MMQTPKILLSQRQLFYLTPQERALLLTPDSRDSSRALLIQLLQSVLQTEARGRDDHERQDHPESS
jgi:hypothetical protein